MWFSSPRFSSLWPVDAQSWPSRTPSTRTTSRTPRTPRTYPMEAAHVPPSREAGGSVDTSDGRSRRQRTAAAAVGEPGATGDDGGGLCFAGMDGADPLVERRRQSGRTGTCAATMDDRTTTQEDRDEARLREELRRRGIPVPAELLGGQRRQQQQQQRQQQPPPPHPQPLLRQPPPQFQAQQQPPSPPQHQQQRQPQRSQHGQAHQQQQHTLRAQVGGSGKGGGKGKGKGGGGDDTIMLLTWRCPSASCYAWSWPCRSRCHRCGAGKPANPARREDWWLAARVPPWAAQEAAAATLGFGSGAPVDAPPHRRVPGLPPRPANSSGGHVAPAPRPRGEDPRLSAPGVLDPPRPPVPRGATDDGDDDSVDDDGQTWARVVRRGGNRRRKGETAGPVPAGSSLGAHGDTPGPPSDLEPSDIPPPRVLEIPAAPRRTIVQKHQAQLEKVDRLREQGASESKLRKAHDESKKLEREVRLAGGPTDKALSFAIKAEDVSIEKARRSLQRAREAKQERIQQKEAIEREILRDDVRIARFEQRYKAAVDRRFSLATDKWTEAAPTDTVDEFRNAVHQLATADPSLSNVRALLQRLLDRMSPPPLDADLAADDTPTDTDIEADGDGDLDDGGGDGQRRPQRARRCPSADDLAVGTRSGDGGRTGYRTQLQAARDLYEKVSAERLVAIENAEAQASRAAFKRALGADEGKQQGTDGDADMVDVLSVDDVNRVFASRLETIRNDIVHLAGMAEEEEIPVPPPARAAVRRRSRPPTPQRSAPAPAARDPSPRPTPAVFTQPAEGADLIMRHEGAMAAARRRQEALDDQVAFQERLQARQELEAEAASLLEQKLAAKREAVALAAREVEEALAARQRAERAPTPLADATSCTALSRWRGPTGTRLDGQLQHASRGVRLGRSPGRRVGDGGGDGPRGRQGDGGQGVPCRERSPRPRQSDMVA